jgi:hypothetical protein
LQCHRGIFVYFNSPQPIDLHGTCDGSGAALSQEAGAGDTGCVAAPELPRVETQELGPWDTWVRVSARLVLHLDLEFVRGGTRSARY